MEEIKFPPSNIDPYKSFMLPILRTFYPSMVAKDLVGVQPMTDIIPKLDKKICCSNPKIRLTKKLNQVKYRFYCDNCRKHFEKSVPLGFYPCTYCSTTGVSILDTNRNYTFRCEECKGEGIISWTDRIIQSYDKKRKEPFVILGERPRKHPHIIIDSLTGILD